MLTRDLEASVARSKPLWEELRGRRLFLTGGTGFFGTWLLESFVRANEELGLRATMTVLTRDPAAFRRKCPTLASQPALEFLAGNVGTFVFPAGEFSHIIHAATENDSTLSPLDPVTHLEANIQGTRRVLQFARQCGARRLLFTSSGAVYGKQPPGLEHVSEDYPGAPSCVDPATAYGQSKRISEFLCASLARQSQIEVVIARPFAFVGPFLNLDANFAIGNFIRDALRGGPIHIQGDGSPLRSYLYAGDLAIWLWTILLRGRNGSVYNVGSDQSISIADLARRVVEVVAPGAEVIIAQRADPTRLPSRYVPGIAKAREELGLDVWVDLNQAIARTANWHRSLKA